MYGRGISMVSQRFESHGRASIGRMTPPPIRGGRGSGQKSWHTIRNRVTTTAASAASAEALAAEVLAATAQTLEPVSQTSFAARWRRYYRRKRRALYLTVLVCELMYIFTTVPLRIAFFFDPHGHTHGWTTALTIYSAFDLLSDAASIASLYEIFSAKRRALAAIALDAGTVHVNPRNRRHQRGKPNAGAGDAEADGGAQHKSSLVVAWSLNTIVPTIKQKFDIRRPLLFEAIAMIPIELLAIVLGPNSLHILRFLKVFRLHRVGDCVKELKKLHARRPTVQLLEFTGNALLLKRVVVGMALCHWIACAYMALAHWECGLNLLSCTQGQHALSHTSTSDHAAPSPSGYTCWAIEDQLVGASPLRKYARATYWSSRSLITLGYYDVVPATDLETAFGIVVQIIGAVFSTSLIATFLFVFRYLNARKQAFMTHVDEAKEYMKMSRIPDEVRDGVLAFYGNVWKAHNGLTQDEVISRLPEHLRVTVLKVLVAQRIHAVSFLAKESDEFINTLALKVELCVYSPKDWIIEKVPDGMYFVIRGNVLIEMLGQTQPRHAKPGEYFAEFALLFVGKSDERARAQTYCEVYKLSQLWFRETVEMFNGGDIAKAQAQLDTMRAMLNRRDMQQQKMKRLFGRSAGNVQRDASGSGSLFGSLQMGHMAWVLPGSTFRRYWEHLRFLALTFVAYEVPYYIVFDTAEFPFTKTPTYNIQSITSIFMEFFFTADVLLRSRFFAFVDTMAMIPVTDPTYIFEHYKENGFVLDLVSIIPVATVLEFAYGAQSSLGLVVPAFRLARLLRLRHFEYSIQEIARLRRLSSKVQLSITLFLVVTLSIHLTGCLWFLMARFGMHEHGFGVEEAENITRPGCLKLATLYGNCSWALFDAYGQVGHGFPSINAALNASASQSTSAHRILSSATSSSTSATPSILSVGSYTAKFAYLRSIYWAIVALTTIGYGDIVAFSTQESFFAALWVYFGGIINYAVVAAMSNIISNYTATSRHHMEKMNEMNSVLAHYSISDHTRSQIRRYYHQQFYIQKVASETKLLARLPQQLRHRISLILHADSVKKLALFVDHGHERLLHDMTGLFRRGVYQRGDHLTQDNTICDEMLVIVSGRGNVFLRRLASNGAKAGVPIGAFRPGSCCGVTEMLLRVKNPTYAIATSVVEVSAITYQAFSDTIEQRYPNEVALLTESALELFEAEARSLDAIVRNMQQFEKLHKYTERCTSMFIEQGKDLDLDQQNRKALIRFYWDFVIALITIYNAFQITFRIPFLEHPSTSTRRLLIALDLFGDLMLGLDIVLKLYYFECDVGLRNIITRAEKNVNYTRHFLKQDLWGMLPLYYFGESFLLTSLMRVPRLLRIRQLPAAFDSLVVRLQQRVSSGENISSYLAPIKLMMILLFAAHFGACVFYWISTMDENPNSWIHHDHVVHEAHGSAGVLYLRGYYWALTTLTLVGSREVVPLDVPGTLFASLMCLCCTFVVGHIIGELSDMILDMDLAKKELQERETSFEQFAKDHNLPVTIRTRVNHYLQFQHHHSKGFDIYETFHDLSSNLKVQLMMDLHGSVLRGLCIAPFLNEGHLRGLAMRLKSELYIPGDNVIVEGDPGHKLYILKSGSAAVMWKSTGTAVATLTEGTLFGEVAFFLRGTKRIASVQATASIEALSVDRRAWDTLMSASEELERKTTQRALVQWVKDCLKGYNVMTVEIVKDIKSVKAGGNSDIGLLEERALRLMLTRASKKGEPDALKTKAPGHLSTTPMARLFSSRSARRIYAIATDEDQSNEKPKNRSAVVTPAIRGGPAFNRKPSLKNLKLSLPTLKSPSTKNGTMRQLFPLANELKDLYNQRQLHDMEDECWRRYKVSILMSGTIVSREMGSVLSSAANIAIASSIGSRTDSLLASSISAAKAMVEDKSRRASSLMGGRKASSLAGNRKASMKSNLASRGLHDKNTRNSSLNSSRNEGVTTDGLRLLANYQTIREEPGATTNPKVALRKGPSELTDAITARQVVKRRRILKRTQSLPIFDRHFADMVREELKASNVKDYPSKLHLGFEVQRRVRRPEFSYLFRIYKWWQRMKAEWAKSKIGKAIIRRRALRRRSSVNNMRRLSGMTFPGMRRESTGRSSTGRSSSGSAGLALPARDEGEIFFELLSRWYRIWECFVVIIAVFYALSLPYLICFTSRTHTLAMTRELTYWTAFVCLMDVFCLMDLVLKYTTFQGVMEMNNEIQQNATPREPARSRSHRISGYFVLDTFAAMPFDWLLFLPQLHTLAEAKWFYLALFQFNKIFRIYQAKEASERLAQFLAFDLNLPVSDRTLRFIRSIGAYLLAGHWIACFWFRASLHAYEHSPTSWISTKKMLALDEFTTLDDVSYVRRYLRSAHFAAGSITTVFYGDIASSNVLETVVEIFVILLSIFVFGMVVGAHSEYLESKYKHRMQFEQNLSELYVYLKNNDVPRTVRSRLKTYYMNTWLRFHGHDDFEGVHGLSTLLVEDIAQYTLRNFAAKVSILKNCDECFLRALLTCLKNVICAPNEPVVRKGDVDRSMYFIARGKIIVEGKGFQLVKEEGDFFGELSLLYGIPRSATCSSLGTSLLYVLEWHAYEALLKDYPEYREVNRREWVVVSTVLQRGESRFRSIIDIVARMENTSWIQVDSIIKKAKTLK